MTVAIRKLLIISGVPIDDVTMPEALDRIEQFITIGRATGKTHQIATVNADFVIKAQNDPELRRILQESDMATADGMPLVWGARRLGVPLKGRVTGADLVPALAARAAEKKFSLFLLGAAPGIAASAAKIMQERNPGLMIAGVLAPPVKSLFEMDPAVLETIRAAKPDVLLVAFGNPKQEKWINMHARELRVPVMIGIGATLDFIAGIVKRAPPWMQKSGMEWLFRLLQEPRRMWKRYMIDMTGFAVFFSRQWWVMGRGYTPGRGHTPGHGAQKPMGAQPLRSPLRLLPFSEIVVVDGVATIRVQGRLDAQNVAVFRTKSVEVLAITSRIVVDLSKADFLDSSGIGALVHLAKQARDAGGDVTLVAPSKPVMNVLTMLRMDRFFEIRASAGATTATGASSPLAARAVATTQAPGQGGWTIMQMPRQLDNTTTPAMLAQCRDTLAAHPRIVCDFSATVFVSSAGLAALMQLSRQAKGLGGDLRVAACQGDALRTMQLARFDKLFPLYANVTAATAQ